MTSPSLAFLLAAAVMIVAALAFVVPSLVTRRRTGPPVRRGASNVAILRHELAALAQDHDRGLLDDAAYAAAQDELRRRVIEETDDDPLPQPANARRSAVAVALLLPVAALALYAVFGDRSALPDDAAAVAEAAGPGYRARLVAHVARQPNDGRAWIVLARLDAEASRFAEAAASFERAIAVAPKIARDAGVWCELADALGMANGGSLAGRPASLIARALALDPAHPQALEMAGSEAYERADYRAAARYWSALLTLLPQGSPAHVELASAVARAERLGATSLASRASAGAPGRP
jgi:cytochrome c-type biogenesis protein CcmH